MFDDHDAEAWWIPYAASMSSSHDEHHDEHHHEHHHENGAHSHDHARLDEADWAAMAQTTEEWGEVLQGFVLGTIERVKELRGSYKNMPSIDRIIDVGSGPAVAATSFAAAFPAAHVTAVDSSPGMLAHGIARANRLGFSDRIEFVEAELPDGLHGLDHADLIWASMSLHHVGDEVAALRAMGELLRADGMIAIAEFPTGEGPLTALRSILERVEPGLLQRVTQAGAAWFDSMRSGLAGSQPSRTVPEMIEAAGLEVVYSNVERLHFEAPLSSAARRVAARNLNMARNQMATYLTHDDIATLEALASETDPRGIVNRDDLTFTVSQLIVIATHGHRSRYNSTGQ